jgi:hypothetical protein
MAVVFTRSGRLVAEEYRRVAAMPFNGLSPPAYVGVEHVYFDPRRPYDLPVASVADGRIVRVTREISFRPLGGLQETTLRVDEAEGLAQPRVVSKEYQYLEGQLLSSRHLGRLGNFLEGWGGVIALFMLALGISLPTGIAGALSSRKARRRRRSSGDDRSWLRGSSFRSLPKPNAPGRSRSSPDSLERVLESYLYEEPPSSDRGQLPRRSRVVG